MLAIGAMLKYFLIDDIYAEAEYGSNILADLQDARRFNKWMADTLREYVGDRVLEIGAGIGTLTSQFIPRDLLRRHRHQRALSALPAVVRRRQALPARGEGRRRAGPRTSPRSAGRSTPCS